MCMYIDASVNYLLFENSSCDSLYIYVYLYLFFFFFWEKACKNSQISLNICKNVQSFYKY